MCRSRNRPQLVERTVKMSGGISSRGVRRSFPGARRGVAVAGDFLRAELRDGNRYGHSVHDISRIHLLQNPVPNLGRHSALHTSAKFVQLGHGGGVNCA